VDLRPPWHTAACTLVFEEVGARMACVKALRLFPGLCRKSPKTGKLIHAKY
jgi:hypothetical protein